MQQGSKYFVRLITLIAALGGFLFGFDMAVVSGIIEPVKGEKVAAGEIDLVVTPLLAFDKRGYRVGYGKGFYDKFFQQCKSNVIRVGLSFFDAEEVIDNINPHDVPLHYCITPQTVYTF